MFTLTRQWQTGSHPTMVDQTAVVPHPSHHPAALGEGLVLFPASVLKGLTALAAPGSPVHRDPGWHKRLGRRPKGPRGAEACVMRSVGPPGSGGEGGISRGRHPIFAPPCLALSGLRGLSFLLVSFPAL